MKQIFLDIQNKLAEIGELKHIDKNWGQLQYEQPPLKFPCALLDIANVNYSQLGQLAQQAEGYIDITIANLRLTNSNLRNPNKEASYEVFDIMDAIHQLLHGWSNGTFGRLIRTNLQKVATDSSYEIYKLTYRTTWLVLKEQTGTTTVQLSPTINYQLK